MSEGPVQMPGAAALIPVRLINPGLTAGAMICRLFEAPFRRGSAVSFLIAALQHHAFRGRRGGGSTLKIRTAGYRLSRSTGACAEKDAAGREPDREATVLLKP